MNTLTDFEQDKAGASDRRLSLAPGPCAVLVCLPMTISEAIKQTVDRRSLSVAEAEAVLDQIMTGQCSDAQIAALLTALRMKGETVDEIIGFARVMRRRAAPVRPHSVVSSELAG